MLKRLLPVSLAIATLAIPLSSVAKEAGTTESATNFSSEDRLSTMFRWWNSAMASPGALTRENFARFFTPDATLTINGEPVIANLDGWVTHFQRIQAAGGKVEIVVPFKTVMQSGNRIYTYHVIRSVRNGTATCWLAAGDARMKNGLIAAITLVRVTLDKTKGVWDKDCWTA